MYLIQWYMKVEKEKNTSNNKQTSKIGIVSIKHKFCLKRIEGLHAKRAYVGFWPIFIFSQDRANFSQTDLF